MTSSYYDVLPIDTHWAIRRNALDKAHCADRDTALRIAFALARGEGRRNGSQPEVRLRNTDGSCADCFEVATCA